MSLEYQSKLNRLLVLSKKNGLESIGNPDGLRLWTKGVCIVPEIHYLHSLLCLVTMSS